MRPAAIYPSEASRTKATTPNTVTQVNRCWIGAKSSSDDCHTNVCHDPLASEPLVARLVFGRGAKPITEVSSPPWPSLDACTHPGCCGVTSGIKLGSDNGTP